VPRSESPQSDHSQQDSPPKGAPTGLTPTATALLVVRHGQSEWNTSGRWQGHADIDLDEAGLRQAGAAAQVLGAFDAIWASDLQRAWMTAQIIAELGGVGPVRTDPRLRETDVGPWEGLTQREVETGWPGFLADRRRPEGFEPYEQAAARMLQAMIEIAADHPGGTVLVVSHGGVIRAVRRAVGAKSPHLPNLSGSWFIADHGVVRAGDTVHLLDQSALHDGLPQSAPDGAVSRSSAAEIL
jgi:broad specificity phosphatase PhoE